MANTSQATYNMQADIPTQLTTTPQLPGSQPKKKHLQQYIIYKHMGQYNDLYQYYIISFYK